MKEESRIEALEHEVKILKNEIQSTLLEIREQLLNHYYPELRAEEPLRSHSLPIRQPVNSSGAPAKAVSRIPAPESTLSEIAAKGQVNPFSDIFLDDMDEDDFAESDSEGTSDNYASDDDENDDYSDDYLDDADDIRSALADAVTTAQAEIEPSHVNEQVAAKQVVSGTVNHGSTIPAIREVDFRKLKQTAAPTAQVEAKPTSAPVARKYAQEEISVSTASKENRVSMAALATWVTDGVAHVGKEQTLQIIDTYATGGKLSDATQNSLIKMIAQADDFEPEKPVGSRDMLTLMVGLDQILD